MTTSFPTSIRLYRYRTTNRCAGFSFRNTNDFLDNAPTKKQSFIFYSKSDLLTTSAATETVLSGGNDDHARNLQACIGECDDDIQCAAGLKCFQRENGEHIPGCSGTGAHPGWDYCYDPKHNEQLMSASLSPVRPFQ